MNEAKLLQVLRRATGAVISNEPVVAVAYSGGVDSSIIAAFAREFAEVRCYTCAVRGSFDALNAEQRAVEEGIKLRMIEVDDDGLAKRVAAAAEVLGSPEPIPIAYTVPLIAVIEESAERTVLAGSGADELFAGYAKYDTLQHPEAQMSEDLAKMLREAERLVRWSTTIDKRLGLPFVDPKVISHSNSIPIAEKISPRGRKLALREVAKQLGLQSHDRPKKAAQYSSGVLRLMEKTAKKSHESLTEWVQASLHESRRSAYESGRNVPIR